jgi:hypothetical protein
MGTPIREICARYDLSIGSVHRHLHHQAQRGVDGRPRRQRVRLDGAVPLTPTDERDSGLPVGTGDDPADTRLDHFDHLVASQPTTEIGTADNPRLPKFLQRMNQRVGNVHRDQELEREVADVERLEQYLEALSEPLNGFVPGVVIENGKADLYEDILARPVYDRPGFERD